MELDDETDELPPDDDSAGHQVARVRRLLRDRRDETAKRLLDASDRLYAAQVRAAKASIPEDRLLALVQALTSSVEAHVLTLQDAYGYADRLASILEPATKTAAMGDRIERAAESWERSLHEGEAVWTRASQEMPLRIAEGVAQVLRDAGASARSVVRWLIWLSVVIMFFTGASALFSWRVLVILQGQRAEPLGQELAAPPSDGRDPHGVREGDRSKPGTGHAR